MNNLLTLVKSCQAGKKNAEKELYNLMKTRWMGICYRYSKSQDDSYDIFQDAVTSIFQGIKNLKEIEAFEGWARRVFINKAIDYHRSRKSFLFPIQVDDDYDDTGEEASAIVDQLDSKQIVQIVSSLPSGYKMVFNLFLDGYDHREIAKALNITESTSRSQLTKARRMIKSILINLDKYYHEKAVGE